MPSVSRVSKLVFWVLLLAGLVITPATVLAHDSGSAHWVEPDGAALPRPPKIYID